MPPLLRVPLLAAVLFAAGCQSTPAPVAATNPTSEPINLGLVKEQVLAYADSGQYDRDLAAVAAQARDWIVRRAATFDRAQGQPAVVFDIDETVLSSLAEMRAMNFGYIPQRWDEWAARAEATPIAPMVEVYRTARAHDVAVIFLTGRRDNIRDGTAENLRRAGLGDYAHLFCKPVDFTGSSEAFKTEIRRRLTAEGYVIIANLGDQQSDLAGGHAERTFKLPNPFYITR